MKVLNALAADPTTRLVLTLSEITPVFDHVALQAHLRINLRFFLLQHAANATDSKLYNVQRPLLPTHLIRQTDPILCAA